MPPSADAEITAAYIDGIQDALSLTTFLLADERQLNAIVRALTDMANDRSRHEKRRELMRALAMNLHDQRTRNAAWKQAALNES